MTNCGGVQIGVGAVVDVEVRQLPVVRPQEARQGPVVRSAIRRQRLQTFGERCGAVATSPDVITHLVPFDEQTIRAIGGRSVVPPPVPPASGAAAARRPTSRAVA